MFSIFSENITTKICGKKKEQCYRKAKGKIRPAVDYFIKFSVTFFFIYIVSDDIETSGYVR